MKRLRPIVLLVLLLTVPLQAAVGAGGMLCAAMMQDGSGKHVSAPGHDAAGLSSAGHHKPMVGTGHDVSIADGHHPVTSQADGQETSDASGKCKTCSECSSAAAPVLLAAACLFPPDTPLRVSTLIDPDLVTRTGDGLFRPPRTSSV